MALVKGRCYLCNEIFQFESDFKKVTCPCCKALIDSDKALDYFNKNENDNLININYDLDSYENQQVKIKEEKNFKFLSLDDLRAQLNKYIIEKDLEKAKQVANLILKSYHKNYDAKIKLFYINHLQQDYDIKKSGMANGVSFSTEKDIGKAFYRYKHNFYQSLLKNINSKEGKNGYIYIIDILKYEQKNLYEWLLSQKNDFRHSFNCYIYGLLSEELAKLFLIFKETDSELEKSYMEINKIALEFYYIGKEIKGANKADYSLKTKLKHNYNFLLSKIQFIEPDYKGKFAPLPKYSNSNALWREKCYKARQAIYYSIIVAIIGVLLIIAAFYFYNYYLLIPGFIIILIVILVIMISSKIMKKI